MSNINPLFILVVGATILSLVLVTEYSIFAQEEEEEDKDDKDKEDEKDKDEEKDEESKDKDKEDEEKEESKDEDAENSNNDTAATQIIQDQLTPPPPINNDTTTTVTTFQEPEPIIAMTPTPPPTEEEEEGEFNATCQCKTTSSSKKPKPPSNDNPPTSDEQIIPITSANIKDSRSFGQVTDPAYTSFYTVPNLLDTIIDNISFWSQAGQSSFYIHLDDTLDNYQVCSTELNIHNPKSTPYLLDVGVSKNYTGVIDQTKEKIQFDKCVKNMDEIYMTFDNEAGNYISIAEIKLFGSKLTGATQTTTIPPTLQPPQLIPNEEEEEEETENATKINIENSTAEIDIKNSTVTFKFDPLTATFVSTEDK